MELASHTKNRSNDWKVIQLQTVVGWEVSANLAEIEEPTIQANDGESSYYYQVDKDGALICYDVDADGNITGEQVLGHYGADGPGNYFYPDGSELADDYPDVFDLETPTPTMDVKVYIDQKLVYDGQVYTDDYTSPIVWGDDGWTLNRITIFVGGQFFVDELRSGIPDPYMVARRAVYAYNHLDAGSWDWGITHWGRASSASIENQAEATDFYWNSSTELDASSQLTSGAENILDVWRTKSETLIQDMATFYNRPSLEQGDPPLQRLDFLPNLAAA